jgi:hypothetical protein
MIKAQTSQNFRDRFRRRHLRPRREAFAAITDRAAPRSDLPPHLAPAKVADIVFGTLCYRLLATRQELVPAASRRSPDPGRLVLQRH